MPIHHAVLSLLRAGPSHGYELKNAFEAAVGPQWGPLNIGHLYQVLERLSRDGMVVSHRVSQDVKPDRLVYEITEAGGAELAEWMAAPTPRTAGFRDDFFLKVMAAARTREAGLLRSVLSGQRTFLLQELRNLEKLRREHSADPMVSLLVSAAARHVTADLGFLDDVEAELLDREGLSRIPAEPVATTDPGSQTSRRSAARPRTPRAHPG
ncbi:PadR family transcriptional regulator [Rhizocola hellebori]|uniref:PadR family transcriptional regulator n=1 Tax=Rhizocola hellebori TaxID=1392758 RepID=A0A8J3Q962_9ACTN|nr:PadR family transcriptional regulator [Rhizocola hellebori]GIH06453.1 PadR family transcriptional regulator [Rhizocola hellebori]